MTYRFVTLSIFFSLSIFCPFSWAQSSEQSAEASSSKTYKELQQEIIRLKEADQIRDIAIKNLIRRIEQLENAQSFTRSAEEQPPKVVTAEATLPKLAPEVKERMRQESEENYQLVQKAFEQRLNRQGSMLNSPYKLTYEPSVSYAYASYDSIIIDGFTVFPVLIIGDIVSEKVRRDIVTNNHSFRLGLPWNTQFDLTIPFGYERRRSFREDGTHQSSETDGLGDISLGLNYQLINASTLLPDTVFGINWKSKSGDDPYSLADTDIPALGTGFETWGISMTSMTTADPIVIFGGLSASYSLGDDKDIGYVQPGESLGVNLGMALSLNLDTSLSFNFGYNYTLETEVEGHKIYGSDQTTSTFGIGMSRASSDFYAMDIDLTLGLTRDSPDFQFTVSFPFEFSLR